MQIKDVRPEPYTKQIRCDRCGLLAERGDAEFTEMSCIRMKAGYGSIFGDGNKVEVDLCQRCLKLTLGRWLRVTDPAQQDQFLESRLSQLNSEQHGGELLHSADKSRQAPEDLSE